MVNSLVAMVSGGLTTSDVFQMELAPIAAWRGAAGTLLELFLQPHLDFALEWSLFHHKHNLYFSRVAQRSSARYR